MRDLNQVRDKLKVVLLPLGNDSQESILQKLRDCKITAHSCSYLDYFYYNT